MFLVFLLTSQCLVYFLGLYLSFAMQMNETAAVHCGFYSDKGGFKISEEDKIYMHKCEVVVSTCAFGGGDDLYQPIGMSELSLQKVITPETMFSLMYVYCLNFPSIL